MLPGGMRIVLIPQAKGTNEGCTDVPLARRIFKILRVNVPKARPYNL